MIIINLIIDKSRLCYKITIKYWQNVPYSQLYYNKTQIKTSEKKIRIFYAPRFFSGQNRKKKVRKLREQIRYVPPQEGWKGIDCIDLTKDKNAVMNLKVP